MPRAIDIKKATPKQKANSVYVGRYSKYANPFKKGLLKSGKQVLDEYVDWLYNADNGKDRLFEMKRELKGKNLWCDSNPCHCEMLIRIVNESV